MKRIILSLLLTLSLTLSLLPAVNAAGIPGEEKLPDEAGYGFTYAFVSPTTIEITAYYGYEAEVTVPSTIDGYTVVGIQSFHNEEGYSNPNIFVRKVVLPETVTYIADGAFYDSDDWSAKTHFELREIVLPQSLKTIGKNAFYHNYYLQKIDIPAGVTEIGAGAFAKCQNLSDITIRGENTLLHGGAFGEKSGYSVGAFAGKLRELHQQWLYDDSASDFFIWQGQLLDYRGTSKMPVIPDTVKVIGASAFWRSDITGVTIPSSVKLIGASAFYECASLTSVDIPGSVERIDNNAFCDCTGMTSVKLNKGLKVIGEGGFNDCEGLTSLVLPEGLTTLEERAFYDCENIERFTFPKSLTDMEDSSIYTSKWYEGLADGTELLLRQRVSRLQGAKIPLQADRPSRHKNCAHRAGRAGRRERADPARRAGIAQHHGRRRQHHQAYRSGERPLHQSPQICPSDRPQAADDGGSGGELLFRLLPDQESDHPEGQYDAEGP